MSIFIHGHDRPHTFHLQNEFVSYIITILPGGQAGQLYYGKRIHDREDFGYLLEGSFRSHTAYPDQNRLGISYELVRREYPDYGTGDYRQGAIEILQQNGSRITNFIFKDYSLRKGKPSLEGLPATYTESEEEAETLTLLVADELTGVEVSLSYTLFSGCGVIARSARITNTGKDPVTLTRAMSLSLDLPDCDYDWMQFSGSWARERYPFTHHLETGIHAIESLRGHSSHQQNPFVILKRPNTDEDQGEAMGACLIYSGNFLAQAQVDTYRTTRLMLGIHPAFFSWKLNSGESFQTPEAVLAFSCDGLASLSHTFHRLFQKRLSRGKWRDEPRPILLNNWEATYFNFNEEKLLRIAGKAKECGVELFVLDDGWFGARRMDNAGLGDWVPAKELLPGGIAGLSEKIEAMGLKFGLWFEPEMVNPDSDLYRAHPDWILRVPGRQTTLSRNQCVLDFSRPEVVDHIYEMMEKILSESRISYIKWDMNRSVTECWSAGLPADRQQEVFHRYILGVYRLYEKLITRFPDILFESCAGGGGRFDAGLLFYAPQAWTSDDTDAIERLKIQYGTSFAYPVSSMGSHVSAVPNHQLNRVTPLKTRADVAFFGTFGYELDLNRLSEKEIAEVKEYTRFMKEHRRLLQFGNFYRLLSPFESNEVSWMSVDEEKKEAIVGYYRVLSKVNQGFTRVLLKGLDPDLKYEVTEIAAKDEIPETERLYRPLGDAAEEEEGVVSRRCIGSFFGDELMNAGLVTSDRSTGKVGDHVHVTKDFSSTLFLLKAVP